MPEERLQRALARAGLGSRRASEDLIREGRVTVNGRVAVLGDRVDASRDVVAVDGHRVSIDPGLRYLAFHKPSPERRVVYTDLTLSLAPTFLTLCHMLMTALSSQVSRKPE